MCNICTRYIKNVLILARVTWKQSLRQGLNVKAFFGSWKPRTVRLKTEESEAGKEGTQDGRCCTSHYFLRICEQI